MTLYELRDLVIKPVLDILPPSMSGERAEVNLMAISLLESDYLRARRQYGNGPARGLWQFEKIAVQHVLIHPSSRQHAKNLCETFIIPPKVDAVHAALEYVDMLAAGFARLNLYTDKRRLAALDDPDEGWIQYVTIWRPGKPAGGWKKGMPTPSKWYHCWNDAVACITE